jgi:hypothetical protein
MEDYLTVDELSSKIKYSKQSLYNLIYKKTFILGKHYFKPTPKKILFKWAAIQAWIEGTPDPNGGTPANKSAKANTCSQKTESQPTQSKPNSSINI